MRAGELRNLITIQKPARAQDSSGSTAETWNTLCTVWASIRPLKGREYYAANQAQMEVTHEITIRYMRNVSAENRIVFGNRTFEVKAVMNVNEENRWLSMVCEEET
jgi:SPP1 family predicted phage head-tail adaptor